VPAFVTFVNRGHRMQKRISPADLEKVVPLDHARLADQRRRPSRPIARIHLLGAMRANLVSRQGHSSRRPQGARDPRHPLPLGRQRVSRAPARHDVVGPRPGFPGAREFPPGLSRTRGGVRAARKRTDRGRPRNRHARYRPLLDRRRGTSRAPRSGRIPIAANSLRSAPANCSSSSTA